VLIRFVLIPIPLKDILESPSNSSEFPSISVLRLSADSVPKDIVPFASSITIVESLAVNTLPAATHDASVLMYKVLFEVFIT